MAELVYTTVETVTAALDIQESATATPEVFHAIAGASRAAEGRCKRYFYPEIGTKKYDWPNRQTAETWRVWFYANDLWSLTSVVSGGVTIPNADIILEPNWSGPPYTSAQVNLGSQSSFAAGSTFQQAAQFTGTWGYLGEVDQVATLTAAVATTTATTLTATGTPELGIGATIGIDTELLTITGKQSTTTGVTLSAGVAADEAVTLIPVSSTAGFAVGETITVGSERMRITDITSGLVVRRAMEGSVLAAHLLGDTVYASRLWTVARGMKGSTAATHLINAPITRYYAPSLVEQFTVAHAMHTLQQQRSAYMTVSRQGGMEGSTKAVTSQALQALEDAMYGTFGRQARTRVV